MTPRSLRAAPRLFFLRTLALALFLAASLPAQHGDKSGETQAPPPATWVIPPAPVLTPAEELKTFRLPAGFHAELLAADPLLGDPIAIQLGPDGRLWVVELRGYMQDVDGRGERDPVGKIVVLDDTDGDGRYDRRTVFLDGLVMPRGLALAGDGVLVAEPPHLWFARDTDGDGVADAKVEIAADYGGTGNVEHMANGLVRTLDNWLYSANHTVRFRHEGGAKFARDATVTRGQWGLAQDDTGRLFHNSNSDPLRYDAVPDAYLRRNPRLPAPAGLNVPLAPADLPVWPGRITPGVNRGYKTLRPDGTLPAVTAACGPVVYRGALFPADFRGDAFICEPSANLVKRLRLVARDGALRAENAYDHAEFLTSTDERFRPVSLYNAPDGALWVVDLYRGVIQHRTYVTSYLRAQIKDRHLEDGRGLGRLWRIVPDGAPPFAKPALAAATTAQLVAQLAEPAGWTRDTAQRLLVEHRDPAAPALLRALATDAKQNPLARLHALWTLDGLDPAAAPDRATLLAALADSDPRVAAAAARLAEKFLSAPADPALLARLLALAPVAADPALRLQLALTLGAVHAPAADSALAALVLRVPAQPFLADAAVSGLAGRELEFAEALARSTGPAAVPALAAATAAILKSGAPHLITRVLALAAAPAPGWVRRAVLDGVERLLPRRADGAAVAATLPAEPAPLVALAARADTPDGARAAKLLANLRWPGKPGQGALAAVKLTPAERALFEKGREQYAALCANCHQPTGQGLAGLAPPLVNSRWVLGPDRLLASIILAGKADENLIMPTLRAALDDEAIAAALTFIRNSWGHAAPAVKITTVAQARADTDAREEPYNEALLLELLGAGPR